MKMYRRKLDPFEAMEINESSELEVRKWAGFETVIPYSVLEPTEENPKGIYWKVKNGDKIQTCIPGDFIFKNHNGQFFACQREVFFEAFELVEEEEQCVT